MLMSAAVVDPLCPSSLPGEDVWSYAKTLPHLFQQGGVFYNIVKKDMGMFVDVSVSV